MSINDLHALHFRVRGRAEGPKKDSPIHFSLANCFPRPGFPPSQHSKIPGIAGLAIWCRNCAAIGRESWINAARASKSLRRQGTMSFGTHAAQNAVNAAVSKQLVRRVVRNNYAEIQVAVWTGIAAEHVDALGW